MWVISLLFMCAFGPSLALAQSTNAEIAEFAKAICVEVEKSGSITRQKIKGELDAEATGVAKLLGVSGKGSVSVDRDGTEYTGVPYDKLPEQLTDQRSCQKELSIMLLQERQRIELEKMRQGDKGTGIPTFMGNAETIGYDQESRADNKKFVSFLKENIGNVIKLESQIVENNYYGATEILCDKEGEETVFEDLPLEERVPWLKGQDRGSYKTLTFCIDGSEEFPGWQAGEKAEADYCNSFKFVSVTFPEKYFLFVGRSQKPISWSKLRGTFLVANTATFYDFFDLLLTPVSD